MSSILNSILAGDLQVQQAPRVHPVKTDSIIELLQNSEIEFKTCPELNDTLDGINTGFGEGNDLHFDVSCEKPNLITPLYKENYLREFETEEEKAAARQALGLYNKGDVVAMSLLTAEDGIPPLQTWGEATLKQLRKGDQFFTPLTSFKAVYNSKGDTLDQKITEIESTLKEQNQKFRNILEISQKDVITSLGDMQRFLKGFKNGDNLHKTITELDQQMLRFEKTGYI